jgi:hypothetical protein
MSPHILRKSIEAAHIKMILFESQIVNHQFSMEIVLPFIMYYTVGNLLIFVVANQKEVVELGSDILLEVFYFLGSK